MATRSMPSHNGPPAKSSAGTAPPSPTLYVKNLPDKIRKPDMRMALYMLFSTYGPVLDVVVMRTAEMRGQGHIVFRDTQASTQALRALQGFDFFGKDLNIQYGKGRSDIFTKLEGVYRPPNITTTEQPAENSAFVAPAVTTSTSNVGQGLTKPQNTASNGTNAGAAHGTKRRREDESDEEEAPMDEDDDDVSMEASSDED